MKITVKEEHKDRHKRWHIFWMQWWTEEGRSNIFNKLERIYKCSECRRCGYTKVITKSFKDEE